MKVLYHHRTLADGAEGIHIDAMVSAFRALGHDVCVSGIAASPNQSQRSMAVAKFREQVPPAVFELASIALNVPEYVSMARAMRRLAPDLVYTRHARYDVATLAAARRAGVPSVLEVNSLFSAGLYPQFEPPALNRLARRLEVRALQLATLVVAVSSPLAEQVRALGTGPVLVLPNGVDPQRFDPRRVDRVGVRTRLGLGDQLTVGWCGILRDWHGLELLLEAMKQLPDALLLVVGDGRARPALVQRAASLGLGERVIVTGRVPHAEMPEYLSAMDIAVVPDERTGVASPMKLLEYMAMARAVVAPRLKNIEEVAQHDRDALLFTPGSVRDLASMLQLLAGDPGHRVELGRCARITVQRERSWRRNAEIVLATLDLQRTDSI